MKYKSVMVARILPQIESRCALLFDGECCRLSITLVCWDTTMDNYADLEISFTRRDAVSYGILLRFSRPDSDADIQIDQNEQEQPGFDPSGLQDLIFDPQEYAKTLTDRFFSDPKMRSAFEKSLVSAQSVGLKLRVRLNIDDDLPALHGLYWETLRHPTDSSALNTNENILFSRYLSSFDWRPVTLRAQGQLSALVLISNPTDLANYKFAAIDVAAELARAQAALGSEISLESLPQTGKPASLDALIQSMRDHPVDILYLVAHGALVNGVPRLWLEGPDGKAENTSAADLAQRLAELSTPPRLVVLASCESAGDGTGATLSAIGPRLAAAGIPAVLAMQGKITMQTAGKFFPVFFNELRRDGQIDRALAVARGAVRDEPDFWMPVLYMRLKRGKIWYVPGFGEGREFTRWKALIAYIKDRSCTPILGPGLVEAVFPDLNSLPLRWAKEFRYPLSPADLDSMPRVAQYLTINQSPQFPMQSLQDFLRKDIEARYKTQLPEKYFDPFEDISLDDLVDAVGVKRRADNPNDPYKLLAQLPFRIYLTTNFNPMIETALKEMGRTPRVMIAPWNTYTEEKLRSDFDDVYEPSPKQPLVYYLFGRMAEPKSMVLTEDNYFDYLMGVSRNNDLIPGYVRNALRNTSLLLVGFRMDEWSFRVLFRSILEKKTELMEQYVHIAAQIEAEEGRIIDSGGARKYLEEYFKNSASINLYWGRAEEFVQELWKQWNALK